MNLPDPSSPTVIAVIVRHSFAVTLHDMARHMGLGVGIGEQQRERVARLSSGYSGAHDPFDSCLSYGRLFALVDL